MLHRLSRITGFHVWATDGPHGSHRRLHRRTTNWQIRYVVIDTSNWLGGKWVAVSPASITAIDWAEQSVSMNLTQDEIRTQPDDGRSNVPSYELTPRFVIL